MAGKLYGVGVGPGDPELLTLKAVRKIRDCDVLAVPGLKKEKTVSYQIVRQIVPEADSKECLLLDMPMTKDQQKLQGSRRKAFAALRQTLDQGRDIAFLTLGDPCIYSTYLSMHQMAAGAGYETEIINGVPSFCAVSAKLNLGLAEQSQMLHIIPSTYGIEEGMRLPGTKVLMKAGRKLGEIKEHLLEETCRGQKIQAEMIENCGMAEERIYRSIDQMPQQAGYYTLMIVKEQKA
ncbi:MAG: precorrin-2 C(20)-methyltransferase [Lachnospiraceae bacterium]|nr:precorrin-2 C(20)-methyltransferase [Lachnospiraceae bacterium]